MRTLQKVFESEISIRFRDCDPFNHLNNISYLGYIFDVREDHMVEYHDYDMRTEALRTGKSWVVNKSQVAFMRPAMLGERVVVETTIARWTDRGIITEGRMWNKSKSELKALVWLHFTYFDLRLKKPIDHSPEVNRIFKPYENIPATGWNFEERVADVKKKTAYEINKNLLAIAS